MLAAAHADAQSRSSKPQPILVDVIGPGGGSSMRASRETPAVKHTRTSAPRGSAGNAFSVERTAFQLMNVERATRGLPTLKWSDRIAKVAREHSHSMAMNSFFSHRGLDGSMVDDRADKYGISDWRAIGENIAYLRGYTAPETFAVEKWMQSPSHRQNLLGSQWTESAIGVAVTDDGTYYFTQVFLVER
ncbi:MAG TPA: CAP domain-containing protein [Pyrinomonadaceae bacterium]|nr:CAP domain-containing protein [Pyrinomonadaceae bacterium]